VHAEPPAIAVPMGCKSAGPSGATIADNLVRELDGRKPRPFDFAAPFYCVSLGRKDGLIQRPLRDGSLGGAILRGRLAAWVKELICKATVLAFTLERYGLSSYGAFRRGNLPALPSTSNSEGIAQQSINSGNSGNSEEIAIDIRPPMRAESSMK
jgi:hypothetical protein